MRLKGFWNKGSYVLVPASRFSIRFPAIVAQQVVALGKTIRWRSQFSGELGVSTSCPTVVVHLVCKPSLDQ